MGRDVHPTEHVKQKMANREVSWGEILEVIHHPEVSYGPDEKGETVHQKGELAVVVNRHNAVKTVLLRQEKQWSDDDARKRERAPFPYYECVVCDHRPAGHVGGYDRCMMDDCRCTHYEAKPRVRSHTHE